MSNIIAEIPLGDSGTMAIFADWVPDPQVVAQQLLRLADNLDDFTEPLNEAREIFIQTTEGYFDEEVDPVGDAWQPLTPNYLRRKQRSGAPNDSILQLSGEMKAAATQQGAWQITERDILFVTAELPFYGPYHLAGTESDTLAPLMKQLRMGVALSNEQAKQFTTITGKGKSLPPRVFIGANDEAIDEIQEAFLVWMDKLIEFDMPPSSYPGDLGLGFGSNVLGTFPIMSFTGAGVPILKTPSGPRFGKL
jgi:hypothetical protein